jgi:peptidoglycan glycosyltransferase
MSAPIIRLFILIVVLFSLLVAFTSRWTVFEAEALRDNAYNRRAILQEEKIKRGVIRTADGRVIAGSDRIEGERYRRRYPAGDLFAHPIGYSYTGIGRSELERSKNDQLTGRRTELVSVYDSILGRDRIGFELRTTLNAKAQEAARQALKGKRGAVVALAVDTGAVLAMYSSPSYDPSDIDDPKVFARLNKDEKNAPLLNRVTQGQFPPGSTMKVVTAAAALDSGRFKPDTKIDGKNGKEISGVPLNNFANEDFGEIDLTTALTKSVNTVWAEVAEKLGKDRMGDYMERFGFYARPELDLPADNLARSGARSEKSGKLLSPTSSQIDIGRVGIGQGNLLVTPLQMAMVAQTVGNGGVRMKPFLTQEVLDQDGRTVEEAEPEEAEKVMSAGAAKALTAMMKNVVKEGTGTAAALEGVELAGKTGTAELNIQQRINNPWFIGFTDEFAVAVMMERRVAETGGVHAAPIAKAVLEALGE